MALPQLLLALVFTSVSSMHRRRHPYAVTRGAKSHAQRVITHSHNTRRLAKLLDQRSPTKTITKPSPNRLEKVIVTLAMPVEETYQADPSQEPVHKPSRRPTQPIRKGINPMRAVGRGVVAASMMAFADGASTECKATSGFHPLTYVMPMFVHQVDSQCAGVVRHNGEMLDEPLGPGLHVKLMKWFGYHITDVMTIPDEDIYSGIQTVTKDHIQYNFDISVTNEVTIENVVPVVRKMGFNYDQQNLKLIVNNAVKEVIKGLEWMDIEVHRATELNELFVLKIRDELKQKYGAELGSKIHILSTTIQKTACQSPGLLDNLKQQAEYVSKTQLEIKKRDAEAEAIKTQVQAQKAKHDADEVTRLAEADRRMANAKAEQAEQEIRNQQNIRQAEAEAQARQVAADQKNKELQHTADIFESHPSYTEHLNKLEVAKSMLTPNTKFVITTNMFDNLGQVVGSTTGWQSSLKQGWCKMTGTCNAQSKDTANPDIPFRASAYEDPQHKPEA